MSMPDEPHTRRARGKGMTSSCASRYPVQSPTQPAGDRGADPSGRLGREEPGFGEPLDHVEEDRREEDAEEGDAEHPAEHRGSQRPPHLGSGSRGDHQGNHPENEGERGHQDGPEAKP